MGIKSSSAESRPVPYRGKQCLLAQREWGNTEEYPGSLLRGTSYERRGQGTREAGIGDMG